MPQMRREIEAAEFRGYGFVLPALRLRGGHLISHHASRRVFHHSGPDASRGRTPRPSGKYRARPRRLENKERGFVLFRKITIFVNNSINGYDSIIKNTIYSPFGVVVNSIVKVNIIFKYP